MYSSIFDMENIFWGKYEAMLGLLVMIELYNKLPYILTKNPCWVEFDKNNSQPLSSEQTKCFTYITYIGQANTDSTTLPCSFIRWSA